jgi:hypothetical protein
MQHGASIICIIRRISVTLICQGNTCCLGFAFSEPDGLGFEQSKTPEFSFAISKPPQAPITRRVFGYIPDGTAMVLSHQGLSPLN